ncbi:MAG: CDP-glucose 4,6-dehydratase [Pseudomonadota bacterium]
MMLAAFEKKLARQRVFVTGHSGFTGGWLCLWLKELGCDVAGLSLKPQTQPNLFEAANLSQITVSEFGDIRDFSTVRQAFEKHQPRVIFHLAAQPLVGDAFDDPCGTIATNVLGTAHVLEAARQTGSVKALVCVTTDKVYADAPQQGGYTEDNRLGGKDPYSASKACAELVAGAYAATLNARGNGVRIATARGGNIIGGGDWSATRIVPDFMRALQKNEKLMLRNPNAIRPWQHVLALVHGYLVLASHLVETAPLDLAWNFGPSLGDAQPVSALIEALSRFGDSPAIELGEGTFPETHDLQINSSKARRELNWSPPLDFNATARLTAEWYRDFMQAPKDARDIMLRQIASYRAQLGAA